MNSILRTGFDFLGSFAGVFRRILAFQGEPGITLDRSPAAAGVFAPPGQGISVLSVKRVEVNHATGEHCLSGLTMTEAEKLLDWLEARGYQHRELCLQDAKGFVVRWKGTGGSREVSLDAER